MNTESKIEKIIKDDTLITDKGLILPNKESIIKAII